MQRLAAMIPNTSCQGDLGMIDDKYDVAISTACGPLDFIVVDNMDTAVRAVDFLKKNNLGVATFIGLDKVSEGPQAWAHCSTLCSQYICCITQQSSRSHYFL